MSRGAVKRSQSNKFARPARHTRLVLPFGIVWQTAPYKAQACLPATSSLTRALPARSTLQHPRSHVDPSRAPWQLHPGTSPDGRRTSEPARQVAHALSVTLAVANLSPLTLVLSVAVSQCYPRASHPPDAAADGILSVAYVPATATATADNPAPSSCSEACGRDGNNDAGTCLQHSRADLVSLTVPDNVHFALLTSRRQFQEQRRPRVGPVRCTPTTGL